MARYCSCCHVSHIKEECSMYIDPVAMLTWSRRKWLRMRDNWKKCPYQLAWEKANIEVRAPMPWPL